MRARYIAALALATFVAGHEIARQRERASLLPRIECAYHEGTNEGYREGIADARRHPAGCLAIRKLGPDVEEIVPSECGAMDTGSVSQTPHDAPRHERHGASNRAVTSDRALARGKQ